MESLKIKVANAAESKEAQELFFELGGKWYAGGCDIKYTNEPYLYLENGLVLYGYSAETFITEKYKEITLQQLRDLVVLKRNDVNDATHTDQDDWKWYISEDSYVWGAGNSEQIQRWDKASLDHVDLKPIQEKQVASHNIEQQALQANPKLFLDPKQNYAEIEWDGTFLKGDDWIEVSDKYNFLYVSKYGERAWTSEPASCYGEQLVWQRTQDEPFLTPESVVQREVHSKNVVQKVNEFSERLKKLEYQFETTGSSASGSIGLIKNSTESINIHGTINPKPDLSPQEEALDVQIGGNHYKNMKIQPVEFALANNLDFCQGSAIKYILRHAEQGGKQDLEKAKHFIDLMIQHYYG